MTLATILLVFKIGFAEAMGFFVLLPACVCHAWTDPVYQSSKPLERDGYVYRATRDRWSWEWLNNWYGNTEDGVSGQQAWVWGSGENLGKLVPYTTLYPAWTPKWCIAYGWSAWRNGANNIKRPLRN